MYSIGRPLAQFGVLFAVVVSSPVIIPGMAAAEDRIIVVDDPGGRHADHTEVTVHSSGGGATAVNVAGANGYAQQNLDQTRSDSEYRTESTTVDHGYPYSPYSYPN